MNISLLAPALQRIINAVDELPDKSSRHFPKTVLDAVGEGRKALERQPLPPLSEERMANYVRQRIEETRHDMGLPKYVAGYDATFSWQKVTPPSKQRITLRGGPLDGCWYLSSYVKRHFDLGDIVAVPVKMPNGQYSFVPYSLPDSHGICYYRE